MNSSNTNNEDYNDNIDHDINVNKAVAIILGDGFSK